VENKEIEEAEKEERRLDKEYVHFLGAWPMLIVG
jgi:hypothetical protein